MPRAKEAARLTLAFLSLKFIGRTNFMFLCLYGFSIPVKRLAADQDHIGYRVVDHVTVSDITKLENSVTAATLFSRKLRKIVL